MTAITTNHRIDDLEPGAADVDEVGGEQLAGERVAVGVLDAGDLGLVGHLLRQPQVEAVEGEEHAERDDEARQPRLDDHHAVEHADRDGDEQ